jgi:hypothetical protein
MTDPTFERRFLGVVEVDSGTILVGDPAYCLSHLEAGKPGIDYEAVIQADTNVPALYLDDRPVLLITQFGGDGTFPVFGEFEDGELMRVTVEFVGPDDDADDGH